MNLKHLLTLLLALLLLQSCSSDDPIVTPDEPSICFTDGYGLFVNGNDGIVINGLTKIYRLNAANGQLYIYAQDGNGNFVIWHDDEFQVINPPEDTDKFTPGMDNGNVYFLIGSQYFDSYYSIIGMPNGKKFQLPKVDGAFPQHCAVQGDECFASGFVERSLRVPDAEPGAIVWVNGKVIRLSTDYSVNIWAINGWHEHYYAVGPYDITNTDIGNVTWSRMGYWRDGELQELDKRDSNKAVPHDIQMHGSTPIIYGYLSYDNTEHRACVWIDGKFADLSQGRDSEVKTVKSTGDDWYAFVKDFSDNKFYVWRSGKLYKTFTVYNVTGYAVY